MQSAEIYIQIKQPTNLGHNSICSTGLCPATIYD